MVDLVSCAKETHPMPLPAATADATPVRIWDLPTRAFHWLLAAAFIGLVVSGKVGGGAMVWHIRLGLLVMGLLLFRVLWGLVGGHWSRFVRFAYGPGTLLRYLRGRSRPGEHHEVGHSPLGALSVFALLGLLSLQVGTGLVADDEIASVGPLNRFVSGATATSATAWHKDFGSSILVVLVLLHVAAIVFYRVRKGRDLVGPMISGDKSLPAGTPATRDSAATRGLALLLAAACTAVVVWVMRLGA
jgi:cytochrome b